MSVNLGTAIGYLDLDISGFARSVDTAVSEMDKMNNSFDTSSNKMKAIGDGVTSAGKTMTAAFTAPIVGFGAASVKAGMDFDSSMAQVSAVSQATGADLETIRNRAIEMGEKTRYSATEVSDAMYYMGLAGWDATQIYEGIPGVLALGAASGEDLSRVSDILTDSLTAFGKSAEDTSEFVNVLAEASRSSNTTVDQLGESFKYVAPVAGSFGYSIQDTAVMLGLFANNGIKGSQAGTGMRQALNSLINPSEKAAAQMEKYNVSLFNSDGSAKDLMTVMSELRGTFGGVGVDVEELSKFVEGLGVDLETAEGQAAASEAVMAQYGKALPINDMEKLTAMTQLFGVRALPGMLSVVNASEEEFDKLSNAIYGAQESYDGLGTAFGMQETMLDNLQGDWYLFTSALDTAKILISDMVKGGLRDLVQGLTDLVVKFNEMDPEQREQILRWAAIVAAIGPVLIAVGKVISIFSKVSSALSSLGSVISLLASPIGIVVAAVAALTAAFLYLWTTNEEFREAISAIWEGIVGMFSDFFQGIVDRLNDLGFEFESIVDVISAAWQWLCDFLGPIFIDAFQMISDVLGGVLDTIMGILDIFIGLFTGNWDQFLTGIKEVFGGIWDTIVGKITGAFNLIIDILGPAFEIIGKIWVGFWSGILKFIINIFKGIADAISFAVEGIINFLSSAWDVIYSAIKIAFTAIFDFFKSIWDAIINAISTAVNFISDLISNVFNTIKNTISSVMNAIKSVIENVWNAIKNFFTTLFNTIKGIFSTAWNAIKNIVSNAINTVKSVITNVLGTISSTISRILNTVKGIWDKVWNGMKTTVTTIFNAIWDTIRGVINSILSGIEGMSNGVINGINWVIGALNNLSFDIPSWVPVFGGKTFGFNIPKLSNVSLPRLAEGGIVERAILAEIGEDGREAVVPLENNTQWMDKIADKIGDAVYSAIIGVFVNLVSTIALMNDYLKSMDDTLNVLEQSLGNSEQYLSNIDKTITNKVFIEKQRDKENIKSYKDYDRKDNKMEQDVINRTYMIYTNKPVDGVEAVRLIRRTERDIAEGFA